MKSLPTGTVTFLFTDIEGSTALLQRFGDRRYSEVLEEHRRLLRDAFADGHGTEINTHSRVPAVGIPLYTTRRSSHTHGRTWESKTESAAY